MPAFEVSRTLVKSAPEVWSELEKTERLAELLGDGAITITRLNPETVIEWRGSTASGKIEIAASSWGTKVRLTAEAEEQVEPVSIVAEVEHEPVAEQLPVDQEEKSESLSPVDEPEQSLDTEPAAKHSFWQNFKALFTSDNSSTPATGDDEVTATVAENEPVAELKPPAETASETAEQTAPDEPINYEARLTAVLDHLGSAHKRPFSAA